MRASVRACAGARMRRGAIPGRVPLDSPQAGRPDAAPRCTRDEHPASSSLSGGGLDDWRVADAQALRAERQVVHKMKAAARRGAAAPSEDERRRAALLRAQAKALLGKAIG